MRYMVYLLSIILALISVLLALLLSWHWAWWPTGVFGFLTLLGTIDLVQHKHNLRRNYPVTARFRWLFEATHPELRQYLFESDEDGKPYPRDQRALVYQRAKNVNDFRPFGTELDVYADGSEWINHSVVPKPEQSDGFRVTIGGEACKQPYSASVFNISAMSFGALSANAIRALNHGAKLGGFAHDTGEGGLSNHHRENGGDLIWEIGSGYFGCRDKDGKFDPERFAKTSRLDQVKMVEIKLSPGPNPATAAYYQPPRWRKKSLRHAAFPWARIACHRPVTRLFQLRKDCCASSGSCANCPEANQRLQALRGLSGGIHGYR